MNPNRDLELLADVAQAQKDELDNYPSEHIYSSDEDDFNQQIYSLQISITEMVIKPLFK